MHHLSVPCQQMLDCRLTHAAYDTVDLYSTSLNHMADVIERHGTHLEIKHLRIHNKLNHNGRND